MNSMKLKDAQKLMGLEDDVREYTLEWAPKIRKGIEKCAEICKDWDKFKNKDFYITLTKWTHPVWNQQTMQWDQKPQARIFPRISCPTPVYKQDVWKYHHVSGELEYLWSIPDEKKYYTILKNKQKYYENPRTRRQTQFVVLMETGELFKWVKKQNGDKPDAVIQFNQPVH